MAWFAERWDTLAYRRKKQPVRDFKIPADGPQMDEPYLYFIPAAWNRRMLEEGLGLRRQLHQLRKARPMETKELI